MSVEGLGGVSGRSGGKALLALSSKARSLQLTRSQVEFRVDWAMDDPSLETGVRIAKGYRGCHDYRA
jgi:hypothetical protein